MFERVISKISNKTRIPVYERSIENVLLACTKTTDIWQIVRLAKEPFNLVSVIVDTLIEEGYLEVIEDKIVLSEKGKSALNQLGIGFEDYTCPKCRGKGVLYELLDKDVIKEFLNIVKNRPEAIIKYDQGYIIPEDTLARVAMMDSRGDLRGRKIIILGDDDLVSIAIGLTKKTKEIAVVEIDERLTSFIKEIASKYGFTVDVYTRDLREPLPEELVGKFDVFETDPPETLKALKLFIGRGIAALRRPKSAGYFGLTLVDASLDKWREFQKILLNEFNVVITDVIRDFNLYENWPYTEDMTGWRYIPIKVKPRENWFTSFWYRIETLSGSKGFNEPMVGEDIYVDEELATA